MRALVALVVVGCSSPEATAPASPPVATEGPSRAAPAVEVPRPIKILLNTPTALYQLDLDTFQVTEHGEFSFPDGKDQVTDIALDREGRLWGVSFDAIYAIDQPTLVAHKLGRTPEGSMINALAVVSSQAIGEREGPDVLIAAGFRTHSVFRVDTAKGTVTAIGNLQLGTSSGDITWCPGVGPVIVLHHDDGGYDVLARLEAKTFTAVPIGGGIGFERVRGIAPLRDGLVGVTETGDVIEIDPATGVGKPRAHHDLAFYGAAVGWADR
jgi:hypothetical protein